MIRSATVEDSASITEIYNWYIEHTAITFEQFPLSVQAMQERIGKADESHPWLVYETDDGLAGYAYATEFKARGAYRQTVETTIYLRQDKFGKGIGSRLYQAMIDQLKESPVHVLVAIIALPNPQSIALHEKLGFIKSGTLREVGRKFDQWVDVGYWQLVLDEQDDQKFD